ncbi:MAG: VCBS repeat-containing protein [Gemmatimonadetes bacterium]|nr:VCBS repeat-containing protein [Gemmatimonadota bacterium]
MNRTVTTPLLGALVLLAVGGCQPAEPGRGSDEASSPGADTPVGASLTTALATDGRYISWRERIIDEETTGGVQLRGSDGLVMVDLNLDGYEDIVSVHESDTEYDGVADGLIRIAFGSEDPNVWVSITVAEGSEAGAPEDVAVGDMNGDGYPDIVAASELGHLIYLQNPGAGAQTETWQRLIPDGASGRGSFIRVFLADLTGDGRLEVVTANKGAQNPNVEMEAKAISWFSIEGDPLESASWTEHELTRVRWPINAQPVDLDRDGDMDVVGGSVAEARIMWFENLGGGEFSEHAIQISGTAVPLDRRRPRELEREGAWVNGFNMAFVDMNRSGRLDIVLAEAGHTLVWLEQPSDPDGTWELHAIGTHWPDQLVGLEVTDINGDGRPDVITGGYSGGSRDQDDDLDLSAAMGRLAWFEHPGDLLAPWTRHDISRRKRGMFDKFVARDMDGDGDVDFVSTRGNSAPYDGVFWLEQVRSVEPRRSFEPARAVDSEEMRLAR